ncbi:site-specific integrase [Hymenobacter metallicola]|nr:site-specific integrase [Hymenobacter metallicola]
MLIRFLFRANTTDKARPGTITVRVTVDGEQTTPFATEVKVLYKDWNPGQQRVKGRGEAADYANAKLKRVRDAFEELEDHFIREKTPYTAAALVKLYKAGGYSKLNLLELFDSFLQEKASLVDVEISTSTLAVYRTRRRSLEAFLKAREELDMRPETFDHNTADAYFHWLRLSKSAGKPYAQKTLECVKQVLLWGIRRKHLTTNPMAGYTMRKAAPKELIFLDLDELGRVSYYPFSLQAVQRAADCFVFQCWTGLAYADLANLRIPRDVSRGHDGRRWLKIVRQKSTMDKPYECIVPLLPEAERILARYEQQLPVISNQNYNRYLKEVAALCGLSVERLTTHIGRKTAGVLLLNAGVRMEVVSKILGHSSIKMTERIYAKILDKTIAEDINRVFGAPRKHPLDIGPERLPMRATGTDGPADWGIYG